MQKKILETVHVISGIVLAVFVLNLTSCKKEKLITATDQTAPVTTNVKARAGAFNTNEKIALNLSVFIPCANGGAGEDVVLTGDLHVLTTFVINNNIVKGTYHYQPMGISGVGSITGDKYQATGETRVDLKGSFFNGQYQESYTNNFRIIGQGADNNYIIQEVYHITINANGAVTTLVDNFTADCK